MSIIRNFFGDNNRKREAHAEVKHCNICTEAFQKGKDDFRIASCADCVDTGRVRNADFYRQQFMEKKANTLAPDMVELYEKLKGAKAFLEGSEATARIEQASSMRSADQIKADQLKYVANIETIKSQVMEHLPAIVAELGLTNVVESKFGGLEFVADMIVPAKISTPIQSGLATRAALREIVFEELGRFGATDSMMAAEASVQSRSHKTASGLKKAAAKEKIAAALMNEGVQRISATSNLSRSLTANSGVFAPEAGALEQAAPVGEEAPLPTADQAMEGQTTAPAEVVGDVVRIPDEEGMADNAMGVEEMGGMPTMNEGIIPNSEEAFYNGAPDLGGAAVPPGMDGGVSRVQQAAAPRVRALKPTKTATVTPNFAMFSFAGKVTKGLPVQAIKLDAKARLTLENAPALNHITASYTDGSTKTWNIYLADKGAIFASKDSEFLAETPAHFASFISSDAGFSKWAYLPEELMVEEELPVNDPLSSALPTAAPEAAPVAPDAIGEGDPTINELEPTVLNPSPDNSLGGGTMNQQETLLHNEDANVGDGGFGGGNEDLLAETAVDMLPGIENQNPGLSEDEHMTMALAAAVEYLNGLYATASLTVVAEDLAPYDKIPDETHEQYLKRMDNPGDAQSPGAFPGSLKKYRDFATSQRSDIPSFRDFLHSQYGPQAQQPAAPAATPAPAPTPGVKNKGGRPTVAPTETKEYKNHQQLVKDLSVMKQQPGYTGPEQREENGVKVTVPGDKARLEKQRQLQETVQAPEAKDYDSLPKLAPVYKGLTDVDPAGVENLGTEKEVLNNPELAAPESARKHLPENHMDSLSAPERQQLQKPKGTEMDKHPDDQVFVSPSGGTSADSIKAPDWYVDKNRIQREREENGGKSLYDLYKERQQAKNQAPVAASAFNEVMTVTASMADESEYFEIGLPALIEAGYTNDEIMAVYAMLFKEADGDFTVFTDYGTVTDVVHYEEPTEDAKRGLHNAHPDGAQEQSLEMMDAKKASAGAPVAEGPCEFDCDEDMKCNHPRA